MTTREEHPTQLTQALLISNGHLLQPGHSHLAGHWVIHHEPSGSARRVSLLVRFSAKHVRFTCVSECVFNAFRFFAFPPVKGTWTETEHRIEAKPFGSANLPALPFLREEKSKTLRGFQSSGFAFFRSGKKQNPSGVTIFRLCSFKERKKNKPLQKYQSPGFVFLGEEQKQTPSKVPNPTSSYKQSASFVPKPFFLLFSGPRKGKTSQARHSVAYKFTTKYNVMLLFLCWLRFTCSAFQRVSQCFFRAAVSPGMRFSPT